MLLGRLSRFVSSVGSLRLISAFGATNNLFADNRSSRSTKLKMAEPSEKKCKQTTELEVFNEVFPQLVDDLTKHGLKDDEISSAMQYFKKMTEYNVPFGKKNRGLTVLQSYKHLKGDQATEDNLKVARVLGWCIEWLQAFFLVADDVMDESPTRRGQPCWYKLDGVGFTAVNDSFFLESSIYCLLKKYCRNEPYYIDIMELFHETTLQTVIGQCLDMQTAQDDKIDFTEYTMDRYKAIVKWKTAFYSFYLPVACALYMAGINDEHSHASAKSILLKMGEFFQIQDDYLDCYGDPAVTGKVGTDIEDNKCSWLVVQALLRVTPPQKVVLENNYGKNDPDKVANVKALYKELNLAKVYADYEGTSYQDLSQLIEKLSGNLPFIKYAEKIYKRQK